MMKSIGIVAEYNPFHQGHKYLIQQAKEQTGAEVCISVMSGDFVQRGAPAVNNKWQRAKTAVEQGVNLVVELPAIFACSSAEYFAKGGIEVLEGFGCIDYLAFGSESGDVEALQHCADFLLQHHEQLHEKIQKLTKEGYSYPKARQLAASEIDLGIPASILGQPNNILAVEYLKCVQTMKPITVKRVGKGHHDSASEIRNTLANEDRQKFAVRERNFFNLIRAKVLQMDISSLENILGAGQGLGNKLKQEIRYANSLDEFIERVKSKNFTYTRISRLCVQVLLDIDHQTMEAAKSYIRILAFDQVGAEFLSSVKKRECGRLPILTNVNKQGGHYPEIMATLKKDILASDLYHIITDEDLYDNADYVKIPFVKK